MEETTLLDLTVDISFKYFFTSSGSEEVLAQFVSAALEMNIDEFSEIETLNPVLSKENINDKDFIVDIRIKTKSGKHIHVEMQFKNHENFAERIVAYNGRLFGKQIKRGDDYKNLKEVYSIVITNFDMFPKTPHYRDVFKYKGMYGDVLTEMTQIHILQLPKLPKESRSLLEHWLKLFTIKKEEELQMILEKAPEMDKAVRRLRILSADEKAKQLEEERMSGVALRKTLLGTARREGEIKGRREGRREGAENLIKFLHQGLSLEEALEKVLGNKNENLKEN